MEHKIRDAFKLAHELSSPMIGEMQSVAFQLIFNAMLAGTCVNQSAASIAGSIDGLSGNVAKWLGTIAEALATNAADQAQINSLGGDIEDVTQTLQTAVDNAKT
jgi:hypothetical protein